jgi:hypothetical protein
MTKRPWAFSGTKRVGAALSTVRFWPLIAGAATLARWRRAEMEAKADGEESTRRLSMLAVRIGERLKLQV